MIIRLLILATLVLPLANSVEAESASNLRTDKLAGNVKIVRTEETWTTKNVESRHVLMTVETYDQKGNKTEWDGYMGSGKPLRSLFAYDDNGNVTEEIWYDSADQLKGKSTYTYDAKGNLVEEISSNGIRVVYSYDSHNNKTLQRVFDVVKDEGPRRFGPVEKTVRYSYDKGNHLTQVASYDPRDSRVWNPELQAHRILYTYDGKGQTTSQTVFNADNTLRTKTRYVYDSWGRIAKEFLFTSKNGITHAYRYTYRIDANGNWITQTKSKHVVSNGQLKYVPVETIYRSFEYY